MPLAQSGAASRERRRWPSSMSALRHRCSRPPKRRRFRRHHCGLATSLHAHIPAPALRPASRLHSQPESRLPPLPKRLVTAMADIRPQRLDASHAHTALAIAVRITGADTYCDTRGQRSRTPHTPAPGASVPRTRAAPSVPHITPLHLFHLASAPASRAPHLRTLPAAAPHTNTTTSSTPHPGPAPRTSVLPRGAPSTQRALDSAPRNPHRAGLLGWAEFSVPAFAFGCLPCTLTRPVCAIRAGGPIRECPDVFGRWLFWRNSAGSQLGLALAALYRPLFPPS
jgi:hypothetical protein